MIDTVTDDVMIERVAQLMGMIAAEALVDRDVKFSKPAMASMNHKNGFEWRDFTPFLQDEQGRVHIQQHIYRLKDEQFEQAWQRAQGIIAKFPRDYRKGSM